jgi:hypothetical protein
MVSLFVYDNDRFIVESFQDNPVTARVVTDGRITRLHDLVTGEELTGRPQAVMGGRGGVGAPAATVFEVPLTRASYRVLSAN